MKREHRRRSGKSGLELAEEATHLLRTAPLSFLAIYFLGAIPFVLGVLYFWADMSRSPFADQHLAEAALGLTLLFVWMKCCQSWFTCRMRAEIAAVPPPRWRIREWGRVLLLQVIVQSSGLFLIPVSLVLVLPFPWVFAFFQNATVLADGETSDLSALMKRARKQAVLWPRQNHLLLGVVGIFAFCVFLNWAIVCFSIPQVLKMLFSIESIFNRSPGAMLNTTFIMAVLGLTYLTIDPIVKVAYLLRCFYGESLQSGQDLQADLKRYTAVPAGMALVLFLLTMCSATTMAADRTTSSPAPEPSKISAPTISSPALDRAINETLHEKKYAWRMPREKTAEPEAEKGVITRFLEKVGKLVSKWIRTAMEWLSELFRKLFARKPSPSSSSGSGYSWIMSLQILLYVLVALVLIALALLLIRVWRNRHRDVTAITGEAIQPALDIRDESVAADQLPEDGWTKLARELLEGGEFRLAMRAFYLASLAHLAGRNLISIARFKSNRDYEYELRRRAHTVPNLLPVFGENLSVFERIWYGMHEVNRDLVDQFAANVERIRSGV
jgi:hypothetical protein